ncbi:Uncharacterised protein [Pseudomonas aeruginosa]|nr:Uncharacterised protein [Pseudomonas aeruginosa]
MKQGFLRYVVLFLAVRTEFSRKALGDDQVHRGRQVERRYAHVQQAGQGLGGAVGVQGGHHHMPGLRRLDGDLGGLQVADLADHDHIRVLAQEGAQRLGEVHALARIDVDLVDAFQVDLHRVFGGGNVDVGGIEDVQTGVQRYRLARAGGAGDQDHALRLLECGQVEFLLVLLVAQGIDAHLRAGGVEDPHHDLLAPQGRQGVDAEVDGLGLRHAHLDPSVLRLASFGDIQAGHYLETSRDTTGQLDRRLGHFVKHAVGTEAHPVDLLVGLEVQVGRPAFDSVQQHLVDEADDGSVVCLRASIFLSGRFLDAYIQSFQVHVIETCQAVGCILE